MFYLGNLISAWWTEGAEYKSPDVYKAYTAAFKSGNPNAIVSYNVGPIGINRKQRVPVAEYEGFLAGECDYTLPTCGTTLEAYRERKVWNSFESTGFYKGPNIKILYTELKKHGKSSYTVRVKYQENENKLIKSYLISDWVV